MGATGSKGDAMNNWKTDTGNDSPTEPTITPEMRRQLQLAARTDKIKDIKSELVTKPLAGNVLLQGRMTVVFALIDKDVLLPIPVQGRVTIGRSAIEGSENLHVDLNPYGGQESGVSRWHAALYRTQHTVSLVDLGSTNGTYINGTKLVPHQPRLLREGDEVRLAGMRFHISFDN
jgi:hypothetical protein